MKKITAVLIFALIITISGCKKDNNVAQQNLMDGAVEYTGTYPQPTGVTFTNNGSAVHVNAFTGQYIAFFTAGTPEADATAFIQSQGGTIISKIPQIGYYLIENNTASASGFIQSMQSGSSVELISPHVLCYPKSGALVLDHCSMDHGIQVKATLTACHGTVAACKDITTLKNGIVYGSDASIIHGIIDEGNKNKTAPTFINLSFNGGLQRATDYDFALLSQAEQDTFVSAYYWHMTNVLMSVAALKDEYRQNLVITIAAGNENFPMADMMDMLRQRPRIADILRDNVLVVSTEKIPGIHANYAYDDADVVVLNNQSATSGSSLAAPCALGYMQDIISRTGVTARQALKAMKDASWLLPDREVTLDNALALLAGGHYVAGACVIKDTISGGGNVLQQVIYNVSSVDLVMRAPSAQMNNLDYGFCYLTVKAHVKFACISGCTGPAAEGNVVMVQDSLEYHGNSLGGVASAPFQSSYAMVGLIGTRSGNTISGYLYLPFVNASNNRTYITLNKQ